MQRSRDKVVVGTPTLLTEKCCCIDGCSLMSKPPPSLEVFVFRFNSTDEVMSLFIPPKGKKNSAELVHACIGERVWRHIYTLTITFSYNMSPIATESMPCNIFIHYKINVMTCTGKSLFKLEILKKYAIYLLIYICWQEFVRFLMLQRK